LLRKLAAAGPGFSPDNDNNDAIKPIAAKKLTI
jgi:hypothetical protein